MNRTSAEVIISQDSEELARRAAQLFVDLASIHAATGGCFTVALAGGETPRRFYETLAEPPYRNQVPWGDVCFFWGDERCVPPDDPQSNYRMAEEALLSRVPLPEENIHRIPAELPPEQAAAEYEQTLRRFFGTEVGFELAILGLGEDGHTASLFPQSPALRETERLVAAPYVEKLGAHRITLTLPVFSNSHVGLFLVSGERKAEILREVLEGAYRPDELPAQVIQPQDRLLYLVDAAAGRFLREAWRQIPVR